MVTQRRCNSQSATNFGRDWKLLNHHLGVVVFLRYRETAAGTGDKQKIHTGDLA